MASSIEYPVCVRHQKPRKDVKFRNFLLCDRCADLWSEQAFAANRPVFESQRLEGYCGLCNMVSKQIRLRTWFLCEICNRVAASIGRNHVAEAAISNFWETHVKPRFNTLKLIQNDPSSLRPRRDGSKSGVAPLDFLVVDVKTGKNIFGIENKTGRSSIAEMSKFQLDVSDCNCITNEMETLKIPVYVIHAQVLEDWDHPPTTGYVV
jgi:hypothetical protein